MSDDNEEPVSRLSSIKKIAAAYQSMYAPAEPEVKTEEEIETKTEEDKDDNSST